jgi:formylglycine-generating enzyme required for sulfatase activity
VVEVDAATFLEALSTQLTVRAEPTPVTSPEPVARFAAPLPERPYKLLDYYEAKDASIFFGRQTETQKLISLIHAHRLVLLYGASGTGKTSLLLAGAVPQLNDAEPSYETIYVRALENPSIVILRTMRHRLPDADLPEGGSLVEFLNAATKALGRTLVIVLDQFEEFFIRLSPQSREAFISELGALYDASDVPVKVVLSLREDWLASGSEIERRVPEVFRIKMRLLHLNRDQAQLAITSPVGRLGVSYEPGLVGQLLDDLSSGEGAAVMPPQLQLVCSMLYDGLGSEERVITLSAYERLGGARGVLQKYLDDELARLERNEQSLARKALEELVTSQRTKAVKASDELALALGVDAAKLEPVLEKLVRARLLRPVERVEGADRIYELAHEYLIAENTLSPEAVARKEAEELLRQGVENQLRFEALLSAETFALIDAQRVWLRMGLEAQELMLRSALRYGRSVEYWLGQMEDGEQALALAEKVLLTPQGEPARRELYAATGDIGPERLDALAARLERIWRKTRRVERGCASDALWALRSHLPSQLRLQLALSRLPRLMRRMTVPLAGALTVLLLIALTQWGPRIWTARPEVDWVEIPAGNFLMGSDREVDPNARDGEMPQHKVYVDAYHISRYEITNAQYAQCVRARVCKESRVPSYSDPSYAGHPVVYVDWFDAQTFCEWVGGRLLTEAEWEYAARGSGGYIYPWGNDAPTCERAQFGECPGSTVPVDSLSSGASWCGAMHMAGNVLEWVTDWFGEYSLTPQTNPTGPTAGDHRVLRGGSWRGDLRYVRAASRNANGPSYVYVDVGIRCARSGSEP